MPWGKLNALLKLERSSGLRQDSANAPLYIACLATDVRAKNLQFTALRLYPFSTFVQRYFPLVILVDDVNTLWIIGVLLPGGHQCTNCKVIDIGGQIV